MWRILHHPARVSTDMSSAPCDVPILKGGGYQAMFLDKRADGVLLRQTQSADTIQLQFHSLDDRPRPVVTAEFEYLPVKLLVSHEEFF